MNNFKIGDKVMYHGRPYKIDYIRTEGRDAGTAKIHSIRSKESSVIFYARLDEMKNYIEEN